MKTFKKYVQKNQKQLLARLKNPTAYCTKKKCVEQTLKNRGRFGTSYCDTYSLSSSLPVIMANALTAYAHYASKAIIRKDLPEIKRHAKAMYDWANADSWDSLPPPANTTKQKCKEYIKRNTAHAKKEKAWKEAMTWLTNNMAGLWW